ncbi:MAG TPA: proline dehydrogenase family protein [Streptosporangiaceae bacterium]|nr:proline dehydrogenase family protein [Streptosporangiaceae bacterium]
MLRRVLLAASASQRVRRVITKAPVTRGVVRRFVAGETASDALAVVKRLAAEGLAVTLDYLGEDTAVPEHAAAVAHEYVSLIELLHAAGLTAGGRTEVSVKPTAVGLGLPEHGEKTAAENITRICAAARAAETTVTIDMEDHTRVDATLRLVDQLRADFPDLGCVVQSYLRRTPGDCQALAVTGSRVRLCKGAYSAPDGVALAARSEVDRNYARCMRILLDGDGYPMLATHDPRLIAIAQSRAATLGRDASSFEYQMLYGIRPDEQRRLAAAGAQVRVYVPYGNDWYGYLVRRLAERPANVAFFLRALRSRG